MSLAPLRGHEEVRIPLARAVRTGQLPGALLFHGPAGIGKQRLALWLAQLLVCRNPGDEPCGDCQPCRMVLKLEHPDVHWFFPLPRPKVSGGADKLGDALEEARAAELAARRADPLVASTPGEVVGIYLAHVQVMRRIAAARPAMGQRKVFIVGDAETLVPQEASQEAANALLKLLEEPPADTTVLVTAADPEALLHTVRSRLLPVRVQPLTADAVAAFLTEYRGASPQQADTAARLSSGSIGRALLFLPVSGQPGPLEEMRQAALSLLKAALDSDPTTHLAAAHAQAPAGARGSHTVVLTFLADWLRDLATVATGAEDLVLNADGLRWLREQAARFPNVAAHVPQAIRAVDRAAQLTQWNVNPQLAVAQLLKEISTAFGRSETGTQPTRKLASTPPRR
jgi:DNA polymerase-3 subunit delta'